MSKSKLQIKESFQNLATENINNALKDLEPVFQEVNTAIKQYNKKDKQAKEKWDNHFNKIENLFYDSLTTVYSNTTKNVNKIYNKKVKKFRVKDIFTLTYHKDNIHIQDRIQFYLNEGFARLKKGESEKEVKKFLYYYLGRLLVNEAKIVESAVKKNKKPLAAGMLIIEGGCTCGDGYCDEFLGEYPIGEEPDWPPYHPDCECLAYYDITDDEDEQEDLDLDDEDETVKEEDT